MFRIRRVLPPLGLAAILSFWFANAIQAGSALDQTLYAKKLYDTGNYTQAISYLDASIKTDPTIAESYGLRAYSYFKLGQFAKAADDFTSYLKINPSNENLYRLRGHCYFLTGRYREAIEDLTTAIKATPYGSGLYKLRGEAHIQLGEYQKAVDDLSQAMIISDNESSYAMENAAKLVTALTGIKDVSKAKITGMPAYDRENMAEILHFRAMALDKLGNTNLAKKDRECEQGFGGYRPHDPRLGI
jgi:tetratricopeptide (TPR) repeat protein